MSSVFDRDSVKAIPLLAVLYLLLKAYVIAKYSLTTAGALVVAAPLTVLVGTVTSYLNIALALTALTAALWLYQRRGAATKEGSDPDARNLDAMVFGLMITSILFLPWPFSVGYFEEAILRVLLYVLASGVVVLLLWAFVRAVRARLERQPNGRARRLASGLGWLSTPGHVAALWVVVLLLPTLDRPWVPAEVLVLRDPIAIQDSHLENGRLRRSAYPVVYVLAEGAKWTTVLDADTRILLRLPTEQVAHRQVCRYEGQPPGSVPIWEFLGGFRYDSPNTMCTTLVDEHELRLDPLVEDEPPQ